jgi:hypothetical protein
MQHMNHRPLDSLKPLAWQLTDLIVSGNRDEARIGELLKKMQFSPNGRAKNRIDTGNGKETSDGIGIWKKQVESGKILYKRDLAEKRNWSDWADTDVIYARGTRKRIVLFGESVARGYYYDPFYNVAKELQAVLQGIPDGHNIEVIDLAMTGQSFAELMALSQASIDLEPDVAIFFAGNNWGGDIQSSLLDQSLDAIVASFKSYGLMGISQLLEKSAQRMIRELFFTIEKTFLKRGIPVVFVVPEFNLKDWKSDDKENALAWLPGGGTEKWVETKEEAIVALKANDIDRLGRSAAKMVALFPTNPMSHELLGIFHFLKGDHKEARACFGRSRDTVIFSGTASKPRCFKMIRDQLLNQAAKTGIEIVDLASIFEGAHRSHIPGKQEFMDYCHLTVGAIKTAMRYTAQKVIKVLCRKNIEIDAIPDSKLFPDNHVSAIAHFSAAIHNAHSGQPAEILQYHCGKAIEYSSKVRDVMLKFVDFSTRRAPSYFCSSYTELIRNGEMYQYEGGRSLMHAPGRKIMDIPLVDAIASTLKPVVPGISDEVDGLRRSEHGITTQGVDLLDSFYSRTHYNYYIDEGDTGLYQARTIESVFYFVLEKCSDPLVLEISCRLPGAGASNALIGIRMNNRDQFVTKLAASADWTTHSFRVEEEFLVDGVNRLIIKWPLAYRPMANDIPASYKGILNMIFPVIGEISSFEARLVTVSSAT